MSHHIPFLDFSFHLIILPPIMLRREWNISLSLKVQLFLIDMKLAIGTADPKVLV